MSCRLDGLYGELSSRIHAGRYLSGKERLDIPEASVNKEAARAIHCIAKHFHVDSALMDKVVYISKAESA